MQPLPTKLKASCPHHHIKRILVIRSTTVLKHNLYTQKNSHASKNRVPFLPVVPPPRANNTLQSTHTPDDTQSFFPIPHIYSTVRLMLEHYSLFQTTLAPKMRCLYLNIESLASCLTYSHYFFFSLLFSNTNTRLCSKC